MSERTEIERLDEHVKQSVSGRTILGKCWPEIKAELEAWRSMYDRRPYVCRDTDAAIREALGDDDEK